MSRVNKALRKKILWQTSPIPHKPFLIKHMESKKSCFFSSNFKISAGKEILTFPEPEPNFGRSPLFEDSTFQLINIAQISLNLMSET